MIDISKDFLKTFKRLQFQINTALFNSLFIKESWKAALQIAQKIKLHDFEQ